MARKIGVLDALQATSDQPRIFIKKNSAILLVRKQLAEWVIDHAVIRKRVLPEPAIHLQPSALRLPIAVRAFVPEKMPPAEISGLIFEDPIKRPQMPRMCFLKAAERREQFEI